MQMEVTVKELTELTKQALKNQGYDKNEIELLTEVVLHAQLRGNNQGVVKLIGDGMPKGNSTGQIKRVKQTQNSCLIDGAKNPGMVVLNEACSVAVEKAKASGVGLVGTFNTCTSTGCLGYYCEKISKQGLISIVLTGSPPFVAPYNSSQRLFGTNPIAFGIPSADGEPIVFDFTTASMAFYGILEAATAGKQLPRDVVAFDANGKQTHDPKSVLSGGAISAFAGHKGGGLSTIVEILTGPLVNASFASTEPNWGTLVIVINPDVLGGTKKLLEDVVTLKKKAKGARVIQGKEILLPGERGNAVRKEVEKNGKITIDAKLFEALKVAAKISKL